MVRLVPGPDSPGVTDLAFRPTPGPSLPDPDGPAVASLSGSRPFEARPGARGGRPRPLIADPKDAGARHAPRPGAG